MMKCHEAWHGALDDRCYLYSQFTGGFVQYLLIMVGNGTDKVYRVVFIVVLHHVALEESLEAAVH